MKLKLLEFLSKPKIAIPILMRRLDQIQISRILQDEARGRISEIIVESAISFSYRVTEKESLSLT